MLHDFMGRDNTDRYGNRHRRDSDHDIGDSAPGTVGDSEGTFHDRARKNNNVIVDGKVESLESHNSKASTESSEKPQNASTGSKQTGKEVTVTVDRISSSGNAIAEYDGTHIHVNGGSPGETYTVELLDEGSYYAGKVLSNKNSE